MPIFMQVSLIINSGLKKWYDCGCSSIYIIIFRQHVLTELSKETAIKWIQTQIQLYPRFMSTRLEK